MKKTNITLAVLAATQALTLSVSAEEQIETMVVTANRVAQSPVKILAGVTTFERADIESLQPGSLPELLSRVAGVNVARNGGPAQVSQVSVRGTNGRHVLVLVDGIRVGSATTGSADFSSIGIENIERVEIVKGPRAALWGSDAVGGVVQIFTRKQKAGTASVGVEAGSFGYSQANASIGLGNEQHQFSLSASHKEADGFDVFRNPKATDPTKVNLDPDKDGYEKDALSLNLNSQVSDNLRLQLSGQLEDGQYDYDTNSSFASTGGHKNDYQNHSWLAKGIWTQEQWQVEGYLGQAQDKATDLAPGRTSLFETNRDQVSLIANFAYSQHGSLTGGMDWFDEEVNASGTNHENKQRYIRAYFLNLNHSFDGFRLDGALRRDNIDDFDGETSYNLSLGYELQNGLLVGVTKGTAFKAPSFNDRYWPNAGNPALVPETSDSLELFARYSQSHYRIDFAAYRSEVEDMIRWAPGTDGIWRPSNIDSVLIKGAELTLNYDLSDNLNWNTAVTYTNGKDDKTGQALTRQPKWTAITALTYSLDELQLTGEADMRSNSTDGERLAGYALLNSRARYQVTPALALTLAVNNLLDRDYQTVRNYMSETRNIRAGVNYRF